MGSLGHPDCGRCIRHQVKGKGAAVYRLIWSMEHEATFRIWVGQRSTQRRWMPFDGREWELAKAATNYSQEYHVMRMLAGGQILADSGMCNSIVPMRCSVYLVLPIADIMVTQKDSAIKNWYNTWTTYMFVYNHWLNKWSL